MESASSAGGLAASLGGISWLRSLAMTFFQSLRFSATEVAVWKSVRRIPFSASAPLWQSPQYFTMKGATVCLYCDSRSGETRGWPGVPVSDWLSLLPGDAASPEVDAGADAAVGGAEESDAGGWSSAIANRSSAADSIAKAAQQKIVRRFNMIPCRTQDLTRYGGTARRFTILVRRPAKTDSAIYLIISCLAKLWLFRQGLGGAFL